MRRDELLSRDPALFDELAAECVEGYLSLVTGGGYPRALAVNFAAVEGTIFFHGALAGEKFDLLGAGPMVGFSMVQPLSVIPSTWFAREFACPATQLFRSVEIKGRCRPVDDPDVKARGLEALMRKYQPEGGYRTITADDPMYIKPLEQVGVFQVTPDSWTGKVKVLQGKNETGTEKIMTRLEERGTALDLQTVEMIRKYRGQ
jgi:nitroimidazol reductase NimA-like FMN-containing flavoprotein (pyridoxamine 5'-phosphate oxidase superfamily)|nr:pyridoxamine 5'-phosphate oxidase family protein [Candidatus Krumholzibacteria bacterium]